MIREFALGWPSLEVSCRHSLLVSLGLSQERACEVASQIDSGDTILKRIGVHSSIVSTLCSLHTGAWFRFGQSERYIVTKNGGRQGCTFGGLIFNLVYDQALKEIRAALVAKGAALSVDGALGVPPWSDLSPTQGAHRSMHVVDVTFVDDEAIIVSANTAPTLLANLSFVTDMVVRTFNKYAFQVNFSKGKTEAIVALRGKGAKAARTALATSVGNDGAKILSISSCPPSPPWTIALRIVDQYRHLGSIVTPDGNLTPEALARASSAMAAYGPLAVKVFGSLSIAKHRKIALAWSLCMSRLFLNVHCWQKFCDRPRAIVNKVYNRVWRCIASAVRFARSSTTDLQVRSLLDVPSIACWMRQRRLLYVGRIFQEATPFLNLLLQQRTPSGDRLPWVNLILDDICVLRGAVAPKLDALPLPAVDPQAWWSLIREFPCEWKLLVKSYHTSCDDSQDERCVDYTQAARCGTCGRMFGSAKAAAQHARIAHKVRSLPSVCVGDISVCQFCGTDFHCRLALVSHLSDTRIRSRVRGTSCGLQFVASNPTPLPPQVVAALNDEARVLRRNAFAKGHSHVLVVKPAVPSKRKITQGIPSELLSRCVASGVRRRILCKTKPALAMLQFVPRKPLQPVLLPRPAYRVWCKTCPADLVLKTDAAPGPKRRKLCMKTPSVETAYVLVQ